MDIYFFTLVSTQIADPASGAQARVPGTPLCWGGGMSGPVSVSSEPQTANSFQKRSSSPTDAVLSFGDMLPEQAGSCVSALSWACPGAWLSLGIA